MLKASNPTATAIDRLYGSSPGRRMMSAQGMSRQLLLFAATTGYGLICAWLLVRDTYLGLLVAAMPAAALVIPRAHAPSSRALSRRATAAWLLLLATASPWQTLSITATGAVNTGSEAGAAKLAVTGVAIVLAFRARGSWRRYSWQIQALLAYGLVALSSALTHGGDTSSLLRSLRFATLLVALLAISSRLTRRRLAILFMQASLAVSLAALAARIAGLPATHLYGSRLDGYLPPLHPNALGLVSAGGILCAVGLAARRELGSRIVAAVALILGVTLLMTQSRTSMAGLIVGLLVLSLPRMTTRGALIAGLLALSLLTVVVVQTNTGSHPLNSLLTHNGSTTTTGTLGSRFSEWNAVLQVNSNALGKAVGQGLAAKSVRVNLASAQYAPVDGTWPAAYLSTGLLGLTILAASVLARSWIAVKRRDDFAMMIVAFLIVSSLATDVFNDITIGLVLMLSVTTGNFAGPAADAPNEMQPAPSRRRGPQPVPSWLASR